MKNFREYILSGHVISIKDLPENIQNGEVAAFYLSQFKDMNSSIPLVTPNLIINRSNNYNYSFLARCLGWQEDKILSTKLGSQEVVLLTPVLNGCTFAVYKDRETQELFACHANFIAEGTEYVYFKDGFVNYDLYEISDDGNLIIFSKEVLANEDPDEFEELAPEENQLVYIKRKNGTYEKKIYIDTRTLNHTKSGTTDQQIIDAKLQDNFPTQKYETIFYVIKSDYEQHIHKTGGFASVFGIRDETQGWNFFCFVTGPDKTLTAKSTLLEGKNQSHLNGTFFNKSKENIEPNPQDSKYQKIS